VHLKSYGLLQPLPILEGKREDISMDFIAGLPKTSKSYDYIWVTVDHSTRLYLQPRLMQSYTLLVS
jgi:hypothetical protein